MDRIISARIKRVVIGIPDPNPEIQGQGITHLLKNNVEVDFFDIDLVKQIMDDNREFMEQFDQVSEASKELLATYEGPSEREIEPVPSAVFDDLSPELIQEYLDARGRSYTIPSPELIRFLQSNGFLTAQAPEGPYIPTLAGILLLGKDAEDFLPQSKIKLEAHIGTKVVTAEATGSILSFPDKVEEFFNRNMRTFTEIKGFKRIEVPEYPVEALREAVINGIVHRDYRGGARVIVQMFRDRIVIKSPGLPLQPLSLVKIRTYNAPPYSRNPRITNTFGHMNLMEERGWGLSKIRDLLLDHGLRPPRFDYESGYFVVTFHGYEPEPGIPRIESDIYAKLNDRQKEILDHLPDQERITSSECAEKFGIDKSTAKRDLKELVERGMIEKRGRGPSTYYVFSRT